MNWTAMQSVYVIFVDNGVRAFVVLVCATVVVRREVRSGEREWRGRKGGRRGKEAGGVERGWAGKGRRRTGKKQ